MYYARSNYNYTTFLPKKTEAVTAQKTNWTDEKNNIANSTPVDSSQSNVKKQCKKAKAK